MPRAGAAGHRPRLEIARTEAFRGAGNGAPGPPPGAPEQPPPVEGRGNGATGPLAHPQS